MARAARRLKTASRGNLPALVLMTDDGRLADPLAAACALPRGSMIVVRARDDTRRKTLSAALLKIARRHGLAVIIADDPELTARLGADGIHLSEMRAGEAAHWRTRFPALLITTSAHSLRAVLKAQNLPVDAIFLSPVFPTLSHPDRASLSPLRAMSIARASRRAVYALGGIDSRNAARLCGFVGIAAIGALEA